MSDEISPGCFAWLVRVKKSCNERWAKFRNDFRKRWHRGRPGPQLEPKDLDIETGTIEISKVPHTGNSTSPVRLNPPHIQTEEDDELNDSILSGFITDIINMSKTRLETQMVDTRITHEQTGCDDISMTSSVISQIAETAVVDSLTCLVQNANQSASQCIRPKTLSEFMGSFGITVATNQPDGMPAVSD